jgi:hypothetical protein
MFAEIFQAWFRIFVIVGSVCSVFGGILGTGVRRGEKVKWAVLGACLGLLFAAVVSTALFVMTGSNTPVHVHPR